MTTRAMNKNSLNRYCLLDSAVQLCRGSNNIRATFSISTTASWFPVLY